MRHGDSGHDGSALRLRGWRRQCADVGAAGVAEGHAMEEKGSHVNLAAHLLGDAWKGLFDAAVVVSDDTDLVTPIRIASRTERQSERVVALISPIRRVGCLCGANFRP